MKKLIYFMLNLILIWISWLVNEPHALLISLFIISQITLTELMLLDHDKIHPISWFILVILLAILLFFNDLITNYIVMEFSIIIGLILYHNIHNLYLTAKQ